MRASTSKVDRARAYDGIDAMTWRGLGLDAALPDTGVLLGFSLVFALLAWWRFRWQE